MVTFIFQNSVPKVYMATPIDVVVFKRRKKFFRREIDEIDEIVRHLPHKKKQNFGFLSNCRYCADRA